MCDCVFPVQFLLGWDGLLYVMFHIEQEMNTSSSLQHRGRYTPAELFKPLALVKTTRNPSSKVVCCVSYSSITLANIREAQFTLFQFRSQYRAPESIPISELFLHKMYIALQFCIQLCISK